MSWRGLHISEPARLSLRQGQVAIRREDEEDISFALEDLSYIVCDTGQITATGSLLGACAGAGCLVVTTDARHLPNGVLLPFHGYYRQAETVRAQLGLSRPRQKRLWQGVVRRKIRNQAACLSLLERAPKAIGRLVALEKKVGSGDPENVEGQAARAYWSAFLPGFFRNQDGEDRANALLNYGYAIVRAALARELTALGFIPCLGFHHHGVQNAFNLADDLIEPWRPFVDWLAARLHAESVDKEAFDTEDRRAMCGILHEPVLLDGEERQLFTGLRRYVEGFRAVTLGRAEHLFQPEFSEVAART